jgi:DNA-binding HxlR family transcriptional regulator
MVSNGLSSGESRKLQDGGRAPVAFMVEAIVGCKWSVRLLQLCSEGYRRPSEFLRACAGLSAKVMNERLRKMTRFGILERTVIGVKPPVEVDYLLTAFGRRFMRIIEEVNRLQEAVDRETELCRSVPESQGAVRAPQAETPVSRLKKRSPQNRQRYGLRLKSR